MGVSKTILLKLPPKFLINGLKLGCIENLEVGVILCFLISPKISLIGKCLDRFLERDAPYNPLCTHYNNNSNDNDNDVVGHSTKYTFYRVTY